MQYVPYKHTLQGAGVGAGGNSLVERTEVTAPIPVAYLFGSVVGAYAVGAGVGYIASNKTRGAVTGGIASSGVWAGATAINEFRVGQPILGSVLATLAAGALWFAWQRKGS